MKMNTYQLEQVLLTDAYLQRCGYLGVFAKDELAELPKTYPSCFVFNTDPSTQSGEHWIASFRIDKHLGYYFDSFGISPALRPDIGSVLMTCDTWKYNRKSFQSLHTTTCGQYCCFFLLHASRGYTIDEITYLLDGKSTYENDAFVFSYIKQKYPHVNSLNRLSPVINYYYGIG
jgi:hypothetical protein